MHKIYLLSAVTTNVPFAPLPPRNTLSFPRSVLDSLHRSFYLCSIVGAEECFAINCLLGQFLKILPLLSISLFTSAVNLIPVYLQLLFPPALALPP